MKETKKQELLISGVPVVIRWKDIKNMYIRIKPPDAHVEISLPRYVSGDEAARFIEDHWDWILEKRAESAERERAEKYWNGQVYETGEIHTLWGEPCVLHVVPSLKKPFTRLEEGADGKKILYMRVRAHASQEEKKKQLDAFYKEELKKALALRVDEAERIVGKHASEWTFRRMKTRWGSCHTGKKKICLNIQLAEKPPAWLDYVIMHELTHLHVPDHSALFWEKMDRFYPDWRRIRKEMRE